jgi:hypothetical protein
MKQLIILSFIFSSIVVNAQVKIRYKDPAQEAHKGQTFDNEGGINRAAYLKTKSDAIDSISAQEDKIVLAELIAKANKEAKQIIVKEQKEKETKERIDALKKIEEQKALEQKETIRGAAVVVWIGILLLALFYLLSKIIKIFKTKQMGNTLKNKLKSYSFKNLQNILNKDKFKNLSKDEIIIASIITGTIIAVLLGFVFGETQYFSADGEKYYNIENRLDEDNFEKFYAFNYVIGITSFLIFSGISFLYLSRKKTDTENREVENAKKNLDVLEVVVKDNIVVYDSLKEENINPFMNLKTVIPTTEYEDVIEIMIRNIQTNRANFKKQGCFLIDYDFENYLYQTFIGENNFVTTYTSYYLVHEAWNRVGKNTLSLTDAQYLYRRLFGQRTGNLLSDIHITIPLSNQME